MSDILYSTASLSFSELFKYLRNSAADGTTNFARKKLIKGYEITTSVLDEFNLDLSVKTFFHIVTKLDK